MTRLVDVKIGRKIIKVRNIRKPLFPLNSEIEEVADKHFAFDMKRAIAKEKKKIRLRESIKLMSLKDGNKDIVLKKNVQRAYNEFIAELEKKSYKSLDKPQNVQLKSHCEVLNKEVVPEWKSNPELKITQQVLRE